MSRLLSCLLWTGVFLLLLVATDQLLLRMPVSGPLPTAVTSFYRDFRERLLDLARGDKPPPPLARPAKPVSPEKGPAAPPAPPASIEAVIDQRQATSPAPTASVKAPPGQPSAADAVARYLFVDEQGTLHFAGTLAEIPEQYRNQATRIGE
jgi:hypothetical protein